MYYVHTFVLKNEIVWCLHLAVVFRPDRPWVLCRGSRMRKLWIAFDSTLEKRQHWPLLVQCLRFVRQDERNDTTAPETTATTCKQAPSLTVSANVPLLLKFVMNWLIWRVNKSIMIRYMCYVFSTCCAQCTYMCSCVVTPKKFNCIGDLQMHIYYTWKCSTHVLHMYTYMCYMCTCTKCVQYTCY